MKDERTTLERNALIFFLGMLFGTLLACLSMALGSMPTATGKKEWLGDDWWQPLGGTSQRGCAVRTQIQRVDCTICHMPPAASSCCEL